MTTPAALVLPVLTLTVPGVPIGQGRISGGGSVERADGSVTRRRAYHSNSGDLRPWRRTVELAARSARSRTGWATVAKPAAIELSATFYLPRAKTIRPAARPLPTVGGGNNRISDLSHYVRAIEDALTAAEVWEDDSQITDYGSVAKRYADARPPGVTITITPVPAEEHRP